MHQASEMFGCNVWLINHCYRFLEMRSRLFRHDFFAQDSLQQETRELVAVPFLKTDTVGRVFGHIAGNSRAHLLLHIAPEDQANHHSEFFERLRNSRWNIAVADLVEGGTQRLRVSIP